MMRGRDLSQNLSWKRSHPMSDLGTSTESSSPRPPRRMAVRDVWWWALLLVGLTAAATVWLVATDVDPEEGFSPAILVIGYAPLVAAVCIVLLRAGGRGVAELLGQALRWRVGVGWYLLVVIAPLVMVLIADGGYVLFGGASASGWFVAPSAGVLGAALGPMVAGAVGEEFGWRGFAQPRLQTSYSVLTASLVIGVLWATWHQWPVFAPGGSAAPLDVLAGYVRLISTAVLYGWLYDVTRSLLPVMVAHAAHDLAVSVVPTPADPHGAWHMALALTYLVAACAGGWWYRRWRRGRR